MEDSVEKETTTININNKDYILEDMTEELRVLIQHIGDLDTKIVSSRFALQQVEFSRSAFMDALVSGLEKTEVPAE
jgi:hypothetical protein